MNERIEHVPPEARDLLHGQEERLVKAARALAATIGALEPDERYHPQMPQAVIVGGYVRDALLGLHPKDADVEVYGVAPDKLKEVLEAQFGASRDVGEAFGIVKVQLEDGLELDVSIPRRESKTGRGHTGFLIDSDPSLDIKEAARRRDFTVNALALNPLNGSIFDSFGGLKDIKDRVLRVTDPERFVDDPLRVLRAVQFIARLGFSVDGDSEQLMREMVTRGELSELSRERITEEFEKLLFKGKQPSLGLEFARRIGALQAVIPEADVTDWEDWGQRLDRAAVTAGTRCATLAGFFSGFDRASLPRVTGSLSWNAKDMKAAMRLLHASEFDDTNPTDAVNDARRTMKRILPAVPQDYAAWLRVLGRDEEAEEFLHLVEEHRLNTEPLLQGRDLIERFSLKPGPQFGKILSEVEAARDRGEVTTREEALAFVETHSLS